MSKDQISDILNATIFEGWSKMKRIFLSPVRVLAASFLVLASRAVGAQPANQPTALPEIPAEYRVLATTIARPMEDVSAPQKTSPDAAQSPAKSDASLQTSDVPRAIAEAQAGMMDLRQIHSADPEINQLAANGIEALADLTKRVEALDLSTLTKPKAGDAPEKIPVRAVLKFAVKTIPHLRLMMELAEGLSQAENKVGSKKALAPTAQAELAHTVEDSHQLDAAAMLLPKVVAKYSAPVSQNESKITIGFARAWGPISDDVLVLKNAGPDLEDCTISAELLGATGESRTNVHFIPKWAGDSGLVASYSHGQTVLGQTVDRATVTNVQTVNVAIFSPKLSTKLQYTFNQQDQDKAIESVCKDLKLTGNFKERKMILGKPSYTASISLEGLAFIPAGRIELTLHRGKDSESFTFPFKSWKNSEAKSFPKLPFDPDSADAVITFPDTGYRFETKIPK